MRGARGISPRMTHLPVYVVDWQLPQAEQGIERFVTFLADAGIKFAPDDRLHKMLAALREAQPSTKHSARDLFEEQMMVAANKTLSAAADPRRMFRELGEVRRWRLMKPEEVATATAAGTKFEAAGATFRRAMWSFATVPVALGTYFIVSRLLREQGVDEWVAWFAAIAAWAGVRFVLNRTLLRVPS